MAEERAMRFNAGKTPMESIPIGWLGDFAWVMHYGGVKYAPGNYRKGAPAREQIGCALRHIGYLQEWAEKQDDPTLLYDLESWAPHTGHIHANMAFFYYATWATVNKDYPVNPNPPKGGEKPDVKAFLDEMERRFGKEVREKSWANKLLEKETPEKAPEPQDDNRTAFHSFHGPLSQLSLGLSYNPGATSDYQALSRQVGVGTQSPFSSAPTPENPGYTNQGSWAWPVCTGPSMPAEKAPEEEEELSGIQYRPFAEIKNEVAKRVDDRRRFDKNPRKALRR